MNLALFFEGAGHGVTGKRTNVSLAYELACGFKGQACHLESDPRTHPFYRLRGRPFGDDWQVVFAGARRWFERNYSSLPAYGTSTRVYIFGSSRGALLARHFAAWLDKLGIRVEYLGVWDTVDATPGLSVSEDCPSNVTAARHAVAADENRRFYTYVPLKGSRVEEELFPGVHSDVGGLYEDNHVLADLAREWILAPARVHGLRTRRPVPSSRPRTRSLRHVSQGLVSNLLGFLRPVRRSFPASLRRHRYRAIVSLGSNIEPRSDYLQRALASLAAFPATTLLRSSSVIETEGVGVPAEFAAQRFLNAVAVFSTELDPYDFSDRMHAVESELGRVRTVKNGPRTIDVDLIDFDALALDDPELTLPHPRSHLREFVRLPLRELGLEEILEPSMQTEVKS